MTLMIINSVCTWSLNPKHPKPSRLSTFWTNLSRITYVSVALTPKLGPRLKSYSYFINLYSVGMIRFGSGGIKKKYLSVLFCQPSVQNLSAIGSSLTLKIFTMNFVRISENSCRMSLCDPNPFSSCTMVYLSSNETNLAKTLLDV